MGKTPTPDTLCEDESTASVSLMNLFLDLMYQSEENRSPYT